MTNKPMTKGQGIAMGILLAPVIFFGGCGFLNWLFFG